MGDFNTELAAALADGETIFGTTFTLNGGTTDFKGVYTALMPDVAEDLAEFDDVIDATIMASKAQFTTAGITPLLGDLLTIGAENYRVLRISTDETSFEFILRRN